jgi:hypothetical protein
MISRVTYLPQGSVVDPPNEPENWRNGDCSN